MSWEIVVGENIRRYRQMRGLTQEKLALDAKIDMRYLGGIERGEHNPTVSVLGRIAQVLEIHPRNLFEDQSSEPVDP